MAAETLTFICPRCQIRLNVPASMAGVTGPCPGCREQITAPRLFMPLPGDPVTAPRPPEAVHGVAVPAASPPVPPVKSPCAGAAGPRIRPEPRRTQERLPPLKPIRSTDDPLFSRGEVPALRQTPGGRRPYRWVHVLYPAIFLALAATIVGLLLFHYGPGGPGQQILRLSGPLEDVPPAGTGSPADRLIEAPLEDSFEDPLEEPLADPAGTGSSTPGPTESSILPNSEKSPAVLANELLDAFLAAPDAASRIDMVEPAASEPELAATLLKGPLPAVARVSPDLPQQHAEEQMTDYPFRVSFFIKDAPTVEFAVLVRQRGAQPPRVFLPAFLDLVGGRLTEFTRQPNRRPPAVFHVHLEPIDGCYEKNVPGADRKFTLKLLPGPVGKETARAYAANASRFREQMESPSSPLRWGIRRRATVTLQWNHKEDPERPYLELVDINSPDWNP
jgi:hypothetical protein